MLELFDAIAENAIEELQPAPLSRLGPGLAFDLRRGPVGRGFEAQLRPGFGDVGDDGKKVDCPRQVLAGRGRCVRAFGLEKGDQSRTLQLLVAQSLLRQVAQGREPLGRSRHCPRRALPRCREPVSERCGAVNRSIEPGERCAGQGKRFRGIEAHQIDQTGRFEVLELQFGEACLFPSEIELPVRGGAVPKIEIDQALVRYANFLGNRLEVGYGVFVEPDGNLLLQL
jgi:hypothetical protein